jgi:hypothetical protein
MAKSYWHMDDTVKIVREPQPPPEVSPRKHLPKVCKYYKKYQGIMPPKCSGGNGCQVCWLIYEAKNEIE